ncbi:MAG: dodecin domain-containing protein [Candidatus Bathyarchaeota archaeon]|nr:dodecin family protein [Candidatus Bathyarchaeum tardum]WGM89367.1 MAG: dodecin family protein [Candidatus Bathyarchaeum tardum]WNZ28358.1 MAG: dodecin domain-containing protein [Candidatus Bathyarchaeota archaeon]
MTIIKVIELVGVSDKNWQDAVDNAIERAAKTIRNIQGVDVLSWTGHVENGKIVEYRTNVKIAFAVDKVSC